MALSESAPENISEEQFEIFLKENDLSFQKIPVATSPRPDYMVSVGALKLLFEVKQLAYEIDPTNEVRFRHNILGKQIREKIRASRRQNGLAQIRAYLLFC